MRAPAISRIFSRTASIDGGSSFFIIFVKILLGDFTRVDTCSIDHYLANTSVLNEVLGLLHTAIFEPNLENGVFKESVVEREKKTVIQRIESIFDDKSRFAQLIDKNTNKRTDNH